LCSAGSIFDAARRRRSRTPTNTIQPDSSNVLILVQRRLHQRRGSTQGVCRTQIDLILSFSNDPDVAQRRGSIPTISRVPISSSLVHLPPIIVSEPRGVFPPPDVACAESLTDSPAFVSDHPRPTVRQQSDDSLAHVPIGDDNVPLHVSNRVPSHEGSPFQLLIPTCLELVCVFQPTEPTCIHQYSSETTRLLHSSLPLSRPAPPHERLIHLHNSVLDQNDQNASAFVALSPVVPSLDFFDWSTALDALPKFSVLLAKKLLRSGLHTDGSPGPSQLQPL
jgi:hypothetical protein